MLTQNRNNVMVSCIISLLWFFLAVVPASDSYAGIHNCSQNQLIGNDLIAIDAWITDGALTVDVWALQPFTSLTPGRYTQLELFIDADQNADTGDARPGAIHGVDYRISCPNTELFLCSLYLLPATFDGVEQKISTQIPFTRFNQDHGLRISLPTTAKASDVFAFAHGGAGFYGGGTGNGDRCPEAGTFDTATATVKVSSPAAPVNTVIDDSSGQTLLGWRFQTFGDQFRIIVGYKTPINLSSLYFQERMELDTDRSLLTGLVQTPFIRGSQFNEIPSWGWDVAINIQGGSQAGSDPTPFYLDFGNQSPFIQPPSSYAFPYGFPFGEGYNDGRWYIYDNTLVLEGSLSLLDTRRWRLPRNGSKDVSRIPTDGRVIGRLFTNYNTQVTDMIPKNDNAFDTGSKVLQPAIQWIPGKMISRPAPVGDIPVAEWDLIQVDGQLDDVNLVISGTLLRLDTSWRGTGFVSYIDTDFDSSTGIPIANSLHGGETIGADYLIEVLPTDLYSYV